MIRFVDLGDQITCDGRKQFAWFDTVTDSFLECMGNQKWENWEDFKADLFDEYPQAKNPNNFRSWTRFWQLFQWKDKK